MKGDDIKLTRRTILHGLGAAAAFSSVNVGSLRGAAAQSIDNLDVIIPFPPGGGSDRLFRMISPLLAQELGLPREPNYRYAPGGGTVVGTHQLLDGPKDATLIQGVPVPFTAWALELEQGNFTSDDLAWIGGFLDDPNVLLVPSDSPYERIDQFIDAAQSDEKTVAVSSPLSATHAATVILRELTGAKLRTIPMEGGSDARNAVAGGHVDACMAPYFSATHVLDLTKAIGIFADENPAPALWQPVPINDVLDGDFPNLIEPYAMHMASEAAEQHPERYQALVTAFAAAVDGPLRSVAAETEGLESFIRYRDPESCSQFIGEYLQLLSDYREAIEQDLNTF